MDTVRAPAPTLSDPNHCPVETTIGIVGGRWKALILFHLGQGPARFNVLRRLIPGITQRMLTAHLRALEADGVVERRVFQVVPPHVEYSLTELGRSLTPILEAMAIWGAAHEARLAKDVARAA
ncbi:winged helix-turn-helix transcriptional regulator [Brevundimonas sp.]|uniref:winged helix-turn-helix transcriptional regulator n=1 Tax=Brevundimonas sp. TaxID=1871086 RepID=UPI00391DD640